MNRYYKSQDYDSVICYVGIAYDEEKRLLKSPPENNRITNKYPLVDWKMTEQDCLKLCYDNGFDYIQEGKRLYDIVKRTGCWCCGNKNLKELFNIYKFLPHLWERLKDLQSQIPEPMKGDGKSVFDLEERFKKADF